MLQAVGFPAQGEAARVVQDPVEHGGGERHVPHQLLPLGDLLVGGERQGIPLVGVRYEAEEPVCLALGYGRVPDLVDDGQQRLLQVAQPESRLAVDVRRPGMPASDSVFSEAAAWPSSTACSPIPKASIVLPWGSK